MNVDDYTCVYIIVYRSISNLAASVCKLIYSLTVQTMFCEMGHLVMTSLQVNVGNSTDNICAADDEITYVVQQRHCTFDPN